ncbi:unnamed protein product [Prorocentrum cordatum]|uniref:Reverse transcriptase domain-containing protein n=1 Tax=Prorocentrum cordatum TaxID=2364126 RepID=A0ABN9W2N2_9DINO|nr:unnamed protein product [Polarella glacialis]
MHVTLFPTILWCWVLVLKRRWSAYSQLRCSQLHMVGSFVRLILLAKLYSGQTGAVSGAQPFRTKRGVKQGDVISPMLFNDGLELAMGIWKRRIGQAGLFIGDGEKFTNLRYADDIMLYASFADELAIVVEALIEELDAVGLHSTI